MKLTLKLFLVVCLFSSVTFAEGDMTTGGKTCTENCVTDDGQNETTTTTSGISSSDTQNDDDESVLTLIQNYLFSLFG